MACWNPWGLCNERFNYCMSMNFDALGLTELHNIQNKKLWKCKRWITSEDAGFDEYAANPLLCNARRAAVLRTPIHPEIGEFGLLDSRCGLGPASGSACWNQIMR